MKLRNAWRLAGHGGAINRPTADQFAWERFDRATVDQLIAPQPINSPSERFDRATVDQLIAPQPINSPSERFDRATVDQLIAPQWINSPGSVLIVPRSIN
ncbi:MAG TPA: hypothetical protein EYO33_30375 [Phycisphaerales bacterium]|nr:hypothetical protein [Phycisphaerales bacterium]